MKCKECGYTLDYKKDVEQMKVGLNLCHICFRKQRWSYV